MNIADALIDRVVNKIIKTHDYHQIYFDDESILNVYAYNNIDDIISIINRDKPKISYVIFTEVNLMLYFDNDKCIRIETEENDSPEAVNFLDRANNIFITI